jgi:hypothetical protein
VSEYEKGRKKEGGGRGRMEEGGRKGWREEGGRRKAWELTSG